MRRLVFRQAMGTATRCFLALAGLFCFFPTYDLLIRPAWFAGVPVLRLGMLPFWIIALGAMALGLVLLTAAILGLSRRVTFDPQAGEMRERGAGAFGLRFQRRHAFRDLGIPSVRRDESSDGPARFEVVVPRAGYKRPIVIETYADELGASDAAHRIAAVLESRI